MNSTISTPRNFRVFILLIGIGIFTSLIYLFSQEQFYLSKFHQVFINYNFIGNGKVEEEVELNEIKNHRGNPNFMMKKFKQTKRIKTVKPDDPRYIINTEGCRILNFDPFDKETIYYYYNWTGQTYECKWNSTVKLRRFKGNRILIDDGGRNLSCFAQIIYRIDDWDWGFFREITIDQLHSLEQNFTAVQVNCYESPLKKKRVFTQKIALVPELAEIKRTQEAADNLGNEDLDDIPSVLLLGIDSVSRLNSLRHMVKTNALLKKKKFIQLQGYNKVGDNTFPNMVPFYTGKHPEEFGFVYGTTKKTFDDWPFIWKEFKRLGHVTMYGEVWPGAGTFHYYKPGFTNDPFDVNTRLWSIASEDSVDEVKDKAGVRTFRYCINGTKEIEVYYNYTYDFIVEAAKRNQKFFAITFMGRMTHDSLNNAHFVDEPVHTLLSKLFANKLLRNTMVLLYADHSLRYGSLVYNTFIGKMEARLPMMNIYIPRKFPKELKEKKYNLMINRKRLTCQFDIHATLMHIATGQAPKNKTTEPYGISLFEEIPETRTCVEAGIPLNLCGCGMPHTVKNEAIKTVAGNFIVQQVNEMFVKYSVTNWCHNLTLNHTTSMYIHTFMKTTTQNVTVLTATAQANPSDAQLEAVLKLDVDDKLTGNSLNASVTDKILRHKEKLEVVGEITRVNKYGNQSYCLTPKVTSQGWLKNFCYCKVF